MVEIRAEFSRFADGERDFKIVLRALEEELRSLEVDLLRTLDRWEGDARAAFETARDEWTKQARDMHGWLDGLHAAILRAHKNYRSSSAANIRMWTS
ncbi:WXG100 family type VII secretion target [Actinomadura gamaensis]|uniref:WXG100 family type VII secretion target n=1 Tax=Actinomadura gamaensis TaxID=1763541 RepID=A0ABV9U6B1_9ACTN